MPLSKLSNNAMYTSLTRNMPKAQATKLPGRGVVPGMGTVGAAGVSPTYQANIGTTPTFQPAQAGAGVQLGQGGAAGTASTTDPRDPTYFSDIARIQNYYNNTTADYQHQQDLGRRTLTDTLNQLATQQPIDTTSARKSYNNAGLFYGTALSNAEGDITSKYNKANTDANTGYNDLVDNLTTLRGRLQNQYGTGANGELTGSAYTDAFQGAVGRQTDRDSAAAQNQLLASLIHPQAAPTTPGAPPAPVSLGSVIPGAVGPSVGSIWASMSGIGNRLGPYATRSSPQRTSGSRRR
jgi:hypothetical protein